MLRYLKRSL